MSAKTEFVEVPESEQLDTDVDGSDDTDALDDDTGDDTENLEAYRGREGPVWGGPE